MHPCSNFWIEKDGKVVLSEWRVALLEAVEQTGSINAAAVQQGVPFRVAWRKLQEMEDGLGAPLTQRTTGGKRGGGTHLTVAARVYIGHFHAYIAGLKDLADRQFREAFGEE
jgi:molybdate transport system regulatory protein